MLAQGHPGGIYRPVVCGPDHRRSSSSRYWNHRYRDGECRERLRGRRYGSTQSLEGHCLRAVRCGAGAGCGVDDPQSVRRKDHHSGRRRFSRAAWRRDSRRFRPHCATADAYPWRDSGGFCADFGEGSSRRRVKSHGAVSRKCSRWKRCLIRGSSAIPSPYWSVAQIPMGQRQW